MGILWEAHIIYAHMLKAARAESLGLGCATFVWRAQASVRRTRVAQSNTYGFNKTPLYTRYRHEGHKCTI